MRVLVTGGAGYVGAHACKVLAAHGHTPIVLDNLVYGHREAVQWGSFYEGDISDQARVIEVGTREKIEAIMHFAAFAYVGESVEKPLLYYQNNVAGTVSLLQAAMKLNVQKFVFSSSCATFGIPTEIPIRETTAQKPISPYGKTKWMIEHVLEDLTASCSMKAVSLRYFNAAGADVESDVGECHDPETHLIPNIFRAMTDPNFHLSVFGQDYDTADGSCVRDYIHVLDLAEAHVSALTRMESLKNPHTCYNLGSGVGFSVLELIKAAEKISGLSVKWSFQARRPGDPAKLVADALLAKRELGWEPRHSKIETILKTAWLWHQKNH